MIELRHVSKIFDRRAVVCDVSLAINRGERVVVCGHSGCGKTTLLRLIAGFEKPDEGEIRINGKAASSSDYALSPEKRGIGMVFQNLALWPHMRVRENIAFGLESVYRDRKDRHRETESMLRLMRLQGKDNAYPSRLSGGERQRIALGRALVRRPSILLMDEPLAHLDSELKEEMMQLISDVVSSFSITSVYVTHEHDVAKRLAGTNIVMREGRIESIDRSNAR